MADKYDVTVKDNKIVLPDQIIELFNRIKNINETIKMLEDEKESIESPLKKAMLKHGVKKFKCDYMTASTVEGSPYDAIDTEKMKADGVYEKYVIHMKKSDYVKISYKKGKGK